MTHSVRLIVLHTLKYTDSSLLVYAYTDLFGRQTYILRGIRTAKKRGVTSLFFPLSLLSAQAYHKHGSNIQNIKEFNAIHSLSGIRTNLYKSAIALFLGEILYRCIKEEEANPTLFQFLYNSIMELEALTESVSNFHLFFLTQFCKHIGYAPYANYHPESTPLFDYAQGVFVPSDTVSAFLFSKEESLLIAKFSALSSVTQTSSISLSGALRHQFIMQMIRYLHFHLSFSTDIKSPEVLRQLFQ